MKVLVMLSAILMFCSIACNILGPSELDLVNGVSANPDNITLRLGQEREFTVYSERGHLDEMAFGVRNIYIEDPVCRCEKSVDLGSISRIKLSENKFIYYAPSTVDGIVELPTTINLYVGAGDPGNIKLKDIVEVTIIP